MWVKFSFSMFYFIFVILEGVRHSFMYHHHHDLFLQSIEDKFVLCSLSFSNFTIDKELHYTRSLICLGFEAFQNIYQKWDLIKKNSFFVQTYND